MKFSFLKKNFSIILKITLVLLIFNLFNWLLIFFFLKQDLAKINFLNVGQGDSELINTKTGNILIDAGPNKKVLEGLKKAMPFYDKYLDIVILSHPNIDHFLGFFDVLKAYKVRAVILSNISYPLKDYQNLIKELQERNIPLIKGIKGTTINLGEDQKIAILSPEKLNSSLVNQDSMICSYANKISEVLFLGDSDSKKEKEILKYLDGSKYLYRILKVAHHGSKNTTSEDLLKKFQPNFAIIEVGKNNYSHPHPSVLERLEKFKIKVFRTDLDGLIQFSFDKNYNFWYKLIQ